MSLTPSQLRQLAFSQLDDPELSAARGTVSSSRIPYSRDPTDPAHVVTLWMGANATVQLRRHLYPGDDVAGFLYFDGHSFQILSLLNPTFDPLMSRDGVTGHQGNGLSHSIPVSFGETVFLHNVLSLSRDDGAEEWRHLRAQNHSASDTISDDDGSNHTFFENFVPEDMPDLTDLCVTQLPVVVPLPYGHSIRSTDVSDAANVDALRDELTAIHPMLAVWLTGILILVDHFDGNSLQVAQLGIHEGFYHDLVEAIPYLSSPAISPRLLDPCALVSKGVHDRVRMCRDYNIDQYFRTHPLVYERVAHRFLPNPGAPPTLLAQGGPADGSGGTGSRSDKRAELHQQKTSAILRLMLCREVIDPTTGVKRLLPGQLSDGVTDLLPDAGKPSAILRDFRALLEKHVKTRMNNTGDVIHHRTEFPMNIVNVPFVAAVLNAHFETESLVDSRHSVSRNISIFTLLAELKDRVPGHQMDHTRQVYYEELVGETASNRTKITTELFSNGRQATIDDLMAALANLDALFTFLLSPDINPAEVKIVSAVRMAFNKLAEPGLRTWFSYYQGSHPWLCHAFLVDVHVFFSEFMVFAQDAAHVKKVLRDEPLNAAQLDDFQATFESGMILWQTTLKGQTIGPYSAEPMTWQAFSDESKLPLAKRQKLPIADVPSRRPLDSGRARDRRVGGSDPEKGLFSYAAGARASGLPQLPGNRKICMGFCKQGSACTFENCKYVHVTSTRGSVADLEAVDAWIEASPGVSWVGGKPALLQSRRPPTGSPGSDHASGDTGGRPAALSGASSGPARVFNTISVPSTTRSTIDMLRKRSGNVLRDRPPFEPMTTRMVARMQTSAPSRRPGTATSFPPSTEPFPISDAGPVCPRSGIMATTHSRPPQSAALVEHPTLTKSMHPEYFHRSALPKAYELARTQKFGKDNLTHSYTTERAFPHVVLPLFKCGFLRRRDLSVLFVAYPRASVLWTEWRRVRRFDFRILRQPNPGWEAQTEIDDHRVDLRLACFLHYNMDFAALQRFHGGNHAGAHRDPDRIVPQIRDLVDPSVARDLDRILRVGCPALFNTEGTRQEFQEMFRYGNHKSLSGNIAKVMKTMNKEDKKEHVLTLPSWLAPLVPDLMLTPNGLVVKPGKNDRLVFDASFMLHADSRPFNHLIDLADEPDIVFSDAWVRYLIWIYNLRISYPDRDIHLFDDDVSGAFRQPKYHPNIISAKCFIVGRYLFGPSGLTFGDSSSPPSYEPFARARMALATHFSGGPQSIPEFPEYLNAVEFAPKASLGTVFARARPDKFNPGVPIPADGSFPPVSYNMHVDDNLYAAVGEPWMRWAMRCSIASLNVVMGAEHLNDDARVPTPEVRPKPCDFEKFTREIVSHRRRQLGCVIDTRSLMVEIPDDKRAEMLHELRTTWGPHRRSFTLVEAAKLLGTLVSLARVCAWGIFLVVNLNCALFTILASNARRLWNTPEFRELVGHRDRSRRHPTDASRFRFFSSAVARAIWNCKSLSWITRDVRDELDFVLRVFANSRVYRWASPIAHLIPREPDFQAWQDSCLDGAGGFSFTLHFWWVVEWPASIRCRSIRHLRQGDTSLISINLLEYAAIILGLAGAICAWESLPVEDRPPFPLLLSWTDNTTAESWTRRVAGFKGPQGRGLARLFAHLLMFSDVGVRAAYVPGELNDIADYLSPVPTAAILPSLSSQSRAAFGHLYNTVEWLHHNSAGTHRARTNLSRQGHYAAFCLRYKLDPTLITVRSQVEANLIFAMYTVYLGLGHSLLCRTIKSGTIRNYQYQAARLVIEARRRAHQLQNALSIPTWVDPRLDCTGKTDQRITDVLKEIERWERMPERREALTVDMIVHQKLQCSAASPHSEANVLYDWEVVGIYAGNRLSEWAQDEHVRSRAQVALAIDGTPLAFMIDDLQFFGENRRRMDRAAALRHPHLICSIDIRWRYQKNGNNGECKTFVRARANPLLCGVSALIRIAQRWADLELPRDHPLAVFTTDGLSSGSVEFIRPCHIESALRSAATAVYNITDATELARFSAHSFRVGACVALHAAGIPGSDIKHALRWKSDTFMMYLRNLPCQAARTAHAVESFNPTRLTLVPTSAVA